MSAMGRTRFPVSHRRRFRVLAIVLGSTAFLVAVLFFLAAVGRSYRDDATNGLASRPLLIQKVRPGVAYRYGSAGIYNACSLVTLDDLRTQGLTPDPDQYLDEYYPVVDQPEKTFDPEWVSIQGPSRCGIFVQGNGHVNVEVLQYPYTDIKGIEEHLLPYEVRGGTTYSLGDAKVMLRPITPAEENRRIAGAVIISSASQMMVKIDLNLKVPSDPTPILKRLVGSAVPRLSVPPAREMELSYSPSDGDGPDACDLLSAEDVTALVKGPADGFAHRMADLAEKRIYLNNGEQTYYTETICERVLASSSGPAELDGPQASFTLDTYHDAASAELTMRQKLDPHGSSFGPPVVLPTIGDDLGVVTAPVYGDRKVVFHVGRYIGELDYRDGTASAESPDVLAHRVTPVAQAIAHRLR